jgi:hypothetical protein
MMVGLPATKIPRRLSTARKKLMIPRPTAFVEWIEFSQRGHKKSA